MKDGKQLQGLSRNQYSIGVECERTYIDAILKVLVKHPKLNNGSISKTYRTRAHFFHDKEKSHRVLVNQLQLAEETACHTNELKTL